MHKYAGPGTYTVTPTATDGWGKSATTTREIVLTEPVTIHSPTVTCTAACTGNVCQVNRTWTAGPHGDQIRYSWNWGDGTAVATTANAYTAPGT